MGSSSGVAGSKATAVPPVTVIASLPATGQSTAGQTAAQADALFATIVDDEVPQKYLAIFIDETESALDSRA